MSKEILINLPVKDIQRSKDFFSKLGFLPNSEMSDNNSVCLVIDDNIFVVFMDEQYFVEIIKKDLVETAKANEMLLAIGMNSKNEVDALLEAALASGGTELHDPKDFEWIYGRSFEDLDGHQWNIFYKK